MHIDEFTEKIVPLSGRLFRFAGCFLKNREDARDVVQDVLMTLWEKRGQLERIDHPGAFAMQMVRNRCIDKIRRVRLVPISREAEARMESGLSAEERSSESKDTDALVQRLIDRLPGHQRRVIRLRDIGQLEFEEISAITGMNVNAIRVCLSRARKQVREELLKIWEHEERRGKNIGSEVL